jgi:2-keto-4-pentenoate hydratase/2-oxohepta-3-ene-1,7-dioic acid hydratase in catechol pathway
LRIATFKLNGQRHVGQVSADGKHVTAFALTQDQAHHGAQPIIDALVAGHALPELAGTPHDISHVHLEAPLPVPRRNVWCVGRNYHAHAKELQASVFKDSNTDTKAWPIVFTKVPECVVGPHDDVHLPGAAISEQIDYEAELAVVIGKTVKHATMDNALDCVFGYSCFNDISVRDYQKKTPQWTIGKNFDQTGGFGPVLVTADELPAGAMDLKIQSRLNGQVMQDANTRDMIWGVAETIQLLTECMTLEPGDLIIMGTPAGVGQARTPPVWMKHGDVVEIEIEHIGLLRNKIQREAV